MKVYLNFEDAENEDAKMTIKLTLPKSWRAGPISKLEKVFIDSYNKKHPDTPLGAENEAHVHFEDSSGNMLPSDGVIQEWIEGDAELYMKRGASKTMSELGTAGNPNAPAGAGAGAGAGATGTKNKSSSTTASDVPLTEAEKKAKEQMSNKSQADKNDPSLLRCTNYGCQKTYREEDNHDQACVHHARPPVFHEARKYWACCPDKAGWDWDEFMQIEGCQVGRHTDQKRETKALGGTEMRAESSGPQMVSGPTAQSKEQSEGSDSLASLTALRKSLVAVGVPGSKFDIARDKVKAKVEGSVMDIEKNDSANDNGNGNGNNKETLMWSKVSEEISRAIEKALDQLSANN